MSVQSIERVSRILRCFSAARPVLGISEIARETGLSTSTTHRLITAMEQGQLVRQTEGRRYALGPLLLRLAQSGAVSTSLRLAALPTMTALRDAEDETVGLHELHADDVRIVVDQVESHHPLRRTYTELGIPLALPYGAPGKVLTAFLAEDRREAILTRPLRRLTPATVTDLETLRAELATVRGDGYALSFAERIAGIHTVAAAIFDQDSSVVGCISVTGPWSRMPEHRLRTLGPRVRDAAHRISDTFAGRTDHV